jgi:hypothetical protein
MTIRIYSRWDGVWHSWHPDAPDVGTIEPRQIELAMLEQHGVRLADGLADAPAMAVPAVPLLTRFETRARSATGRVP